MRYGDFIRGKKSMGSNRTLRDLGSNGSIGNIWEDTEETGISSSLRSTTSYYTDWFGDFSNNSEKKEREITVTLKSLRNLKETINRWVNQKGLDPKFNMETRERFYTIRKTRSGEFEVKTEILNTPSGFTVPSRIDDIKFEDLENYLITDVSDGIKWIKKI
jgi:hypothetical protein